MNLIRLHTAALFASIMLTATLAMAASTASPGNAFTSALPAAYMDDPRRNEWQMPSAVLERLQVKPGYHVADVGAGTGYFTLQLAQKTTETGIVYAIDIDPAMLQIITQRAKASSLAHIKPILVFGNEFPKLQSPLDLLLLCDTYLFIENRINYLGHVHNALKDTGILAIISFNAAADISGAPPPHMTIAKAITIAEAEKAGFALDADYPFLPYQDFLIFRKR